MWVAARQSGLKIPAFRNISTPLINSRRWSCVTQHSWLWHKIYVPVTCLHVLGTSSHAYPSTPVLYPSQCVGTCTQWLQACSCYWWEGLAQLKHIRPKDPQLSERNCKWCKRVAPPAASPPHFKWLRCLAGTGRAPVLRAGGWEISDLNLNLLWICNSVLQQPKLRVNHR